MSELLELLMDYFDGRIGIDEFGVCSCGMQPHIDGHTPDCKFARLKLLMLRERTKEK